MGGVRGNRGVVAASVGQLGLALAGFMVAVRRGHAYDVPLLHGDPARMLEQSVVMGTALSQPAAMMAAQAWLTAVVARRGDPRAVRGLQVLGGVMLAGYLAERLVRTRLRWHGWDPVETPLVVAGMGLSAAMVPLGFTARRRR
ncbi:MAG TPA: hypothetical protein VM324_04505 [Egibacteraceae bacterium]|nr:hypothetical protein [Egibacteraceae bacterium]